MAAQLDVEDGRCLSLSCTPEKLSTAEKLAITPSTEAGSWFGEGAPLLEPLGEPSATAAATAATGPFSADNAVLITKGLLAFSCLFFLCEALTDWVVDILGTIFMTSALGAATVAAPPLASVSAVILSFFGFSLHVPIAERAVGAVGIVLMLLLFIAGIVSFGLRIREYGCASMWQWKAWQLGDAPLLEAYLKSLPCARGCPRVVCSVEGPTCCTNALARVKTFVLEGLRILLSFVFVLVLILCLAGGFVMLSTELPAGIESYDPELVWPAAAIAAGREPPITLGTTANMNTHGYPIDFTGIWRLKWDDEPIPLYGKMHLEELVSFADWDYFAEPDQPPVPPVNSSDSNYVNGKLYPVAFGPKTGRARRWGFSNSLVGRISMMANSAKNPRSPLKLTMDGPESFDISGGETAMSKAWMMYRISDDEWLRWIYRGENTPGWYYTLTRVVRGDGTKVPVHFDDFVKNMQATKIRVYSKDFEDDGHNGPKTKACRICGTHPFGTDLICDCP